MSNQSDHNGDVAQLPLWVCADCKKTVEDEDRRAATTMASLLVSMVGVLSLDVLRQLHLSFSLFVCTFELYHRLNDILCFM